MKIIQQDEKIIAYIDKDETNERKIMNMKMIESIQENGVTDYEVNSENPRLYSESGLLYGKKKTMPNGETRLTLIAAPPDKKGTVKVAYGTEIIAGGAFADSKASKVILPETVCLCQAFCADFAKLSQPAILRPLSACCIIKQRDIAPGCEAGLLRYQKGGAFLESIQRYWKRTDKVYLLLCLFSSGMAVLALASWAAKQGNGFAVDGLTGQITGVGDYRRAMVQAGAAAIGIVVAILLSNIDYRSLVNVWPVHVALTWGLVLPTLVIRNVSIGPLTIGYNAGDTDNYSWYKLGGFTFQPTELAKISFILTFAMHLNNVRSRLNEPKELGKLLLHLFVPIAIIHIQGDDGTAIIYGIIGCCMLFAAGLSWKYIVGAASALAAAMAVAFAFFSDKIGKGYQWYRILAVIDPNNETGWAPSETVWKNIIYQQQRGEIAIGSGGIFGNGFFEGRYYSVPNAHNDFILCWIGNTAGFVGCCVVLGVLLAIIIKTFATGAGSEDMLGSFICAGIGGALMAQIFVNVGMNLRVLPVIGVTLPFYSAGGSSVLMLYICVGLVLSVYMHNTKKLFG